MGLKNQLLRSNWGMCLNIVFDLVNVKYQIKYADGVFCKQRLDKARIGEYYITGEKKWPKPIIHFAVAAHEYTNAVGERFWRVYSTLICIS